MGVEAVVFDWGGTLSVWADIDISTMWLAAARHIAPARDAELTGALIAAEALSWERVRTDRRSTRLADLLAAACAEIDLDVPGPALEGAATCHLDAWVPYVRHQGDAATVLSRLKAAGLKVGLLSNTHWPRSFHERFLDRDGLAGLIDVRFYTSDMDYVKPHPSAYLDVLEALGVQDPASAVFVGDRLYDDVWGARQAGLRAVWLRNPRAPYFDAEPDGVIDSLSELPALLAGL
ncbi:MAG: HAD family hydrolase [Acidimicrobiales bacterium]